MQATHKHQSRREVIFLPFPLPLSLLLYEYILFSLIFFCYFLLFSSFILFITIYCEIYRYQIRISPWILWTLNSLGFP